MPAAKSTRISFLNVEIWPPLVFVLGYLAKENGWANVADIRSQVMSHGGWDNFDFWFRLLSGMKLVKVDESDEARAAITKEGLAVLREQLESAKAVTMLWGDILYREQQAEQEPQEDRPGDKWNLLPKEQALGGIGLYTCDTCEHSFKEPFERFRIPPCPQCGKKSAVHQYDLEMPDEQAG